MAEDLWPYSDGRPGWEEIMGWVNSAKILGLTTANDLDYFVGGCGAQHGEKLHQLRRDLDKTLSMKGKLTFADMVLDVEVKLRQDRQFREHWQEKFKYILCDEGQDTSGQAMRVLTTLAAPQDQFTLVGDGDQLLYRFCGATPEANLYDGFEERFPEGILIKLTVNYRSTRAIIDTCQRLIMHNYREPVDPYKAIEQFDHIPYQGPYNWKYLKDVEPRPDAPEGAPVTWSMYPDPEQEAINLAGSIQQQFDLFERKPGEFFVGA